MEMESLTGLHLLETGQLLKLARKYVHFYCSLTTFLVFATFELSVYEN